MRSSTALLQFEQQYTWPLLWQYFLLHLIRFDNAIPFFSNNCANSGCSFWLHARVRIRVGGSVATAADNSLKSFSESVVWKLKLYENSCVFSEPNRNDK